MPLAELVPGFVRSGKVRDIFALDDERLLLVASDRISAFDVVLPTPIPGQGPRPDRHLALLVPRDRRRRDHAQSPAVDGRGDAARRVRRGGSGAARPVDDLPPCRRAARRADRPRLPGRQWLEGLRPHRRRVRHPAAGRVCARASGCPSRCSRPRPRPRWATTRTSRSTRWSRLVGAGHVPSRHDRWRSRCTSSPRRERSLPGIILADTKFEFGIVDSRAR